MRQLTHAFFVCQDNIMRTDLLREKSEIGELYYSKVVPEYVIEALNKDGIYPKRREVYEVDMDKEEIIGLAKKDEPFPSFEEIYEGNRKRIYINKYTLDYFVENADSQTYILMSRKEKKSIKNFVYEYSKLTGSQVKETEKPAEGVYCGDRFFTEKYFARSYKKEGAALRKDAWILQNIGTFKSLKRMRHYRRFKLMKWMKRSGIKSDSSFAIIKGDDIVKIWNKKYKCIFFSFPSFVNFYLRKADRDKSFVVYDITDNWKNINIGSVFNSNEKQLIDRADLLFCSSKYIYDDLEKQYRKKAVFIPNGHTNRKFRKIKKFGRKTAAYVGISGQKVDFDLVYNLARENKEWNFSIIGLNDVNSEALAKKPDNVFFFKEMSEKKMFKYLCRCSIGLIPFKESNGTEGMLPLKLFDYANAHIPVVYQNCINIKDYKIVYDAKKIPSLDYVLKNCPKESDYEEIIKESDWDGKFKKMIIAITAKS